MPLIEPQNKLKKVLKKLPPGGLHVLSLGAGNELYDAIEENIQKGKKNILPKLEKIVGCKRPSYNGRQWEGNQIHPILKEMHCFTEGFRLLKDLHQTVT